MYKGYLQLGGVEIVNAARVEAYVAKNMPQFPLNMDLVCGDLAEVLGETYESPLVDDAPWVDNSDPATTGFYGVYPLSLDGGVDSTRQVDIQESIGTGGAIGQSRLASREMRMRALLIATDDLALDSGLTWLRQALNPAACDSHGGSCGGASLCFYAACPELCVSYHDYDEDLREVIVLGDVNNSTSPLVHNLADVDANVRAEWSLPTTDSTLVRWGALSDDSGEVLEQSDVTMLQRTNFFRKDLPFWQGMPGGEQTISRIEEGGVHGGAFIRVEPNEPSTIRVNLVADPSFENGFSPEELGVKTNGVATIEPVSRGGSALVVAPSRTAPTWVSVPILDPTEYDSFGLLSFDIRSPFTDVDVEVLDEQGQVAAYLLIDEVDLGGSDEWTRHSFNSPLGKGYSLRFSTTTIAISTLSVDRILVEPGVAGGPLILTPDPTNENVFIIESGAIPDPDGDQLSTQSGAIDITNPDMLVLESVSIDPADDDMLVFADGTAFSEDPDVFILTDEDAGIYFDGNSIPGAGVVYDYPTGSPLGPSYAITRSTSPIMFRTLDTESTFGTITASFQARSMDGGTFVARIISSLEGIILGSTIVQPTNTWGTVAITVPFGLRARLEIIGLGSIDIDEPVLESGEAVIPYFDGSTSPLAFGDEGEYEVSWLGAVGASASRMRWTGRAITERCGTDWRPFLDVAQGVVPGAQLTVDYGLAVSPAEQSERYERNLHEVVAISGPKVLREFALEVGSMVMVEFGLAATKPSPYGPTRDLFVRELMSELPTTPWIDPEPADIPSSVIQDPDCAIMPVAPRPPVVPNLCVADPSSWRRFWLDIPASEVSAWSQTVPTIMLNSGPDAVRQVRVRFYPNPFEYEARNGESTAVVRKNLARNSSLETSATNWSLVSTAGGVTLNREISILGHTNHGQYVGRVRRISTASAFALRVKAGGVAAEGFVPGDDITVGLDVFSPNTDTQPGNGARLSILYEVLMPNGTKEIRAIEGLVAEGKPTPAKKTVRMVNHKKIPALAAGESISDIIVQVAHTLGTLNNFLDYDSLTIERGFTDGSYFDGASPSIPGAVENVWIGTPYLSASQQTTYTSTAPIDPDSWCSEFILSYLPAQTEIVIDGTVERAYASVAGASSEPANHLLYGTGGVPMSWPELSCNIPYAVTIDVPPAEADNVSVSLALTRRE